MFEILRYWWRRPDRYDVLSDHLAVRQLQTFARGATAVYFAGLGVVSLLLLDDIALHTRPWLRPLAIGFAAGWIAIAGVWVVHWPTRRQSLAFILFADTGMAFNCLAPADPRTGLIGCIAFAAAAGFVAFFHTSGYLLATVGIALATTGIGVYRYAAAGNPAGAISALIVIAFSLLSVPITVKVSVHVLGDLDIDSDTDELTGLRNRRGFTRAAKELVRWVQSSGQTRVGVIMVDLDRFKLINDTRGHAAGDRLLMAVGEILAKATEIDETVVARYGGEEFVIAAALGSAALQDIADKVRAEVATLPDAVTVSVGIAGTHQITAGDDGLLERLVDSADEAMYRAKRAGGNRVVNLVDHPE